MLETDDDCGPPLRSLPCRELKTVAEHTDVTRVWMQEIDRPVFSFQTVVAKGTCDLKLKSPETGREQIRGSLRLDTPAVQGKAIQMISEQLYQLRLAIRTYPHTEFFEGHATPVDFNTRIGDIRDNSFEKHSVTTHSRFGESRDGCRTVF